MKNIISIALLSFTLLGCATKMSDVRIENGKTMKEIQDETFSDHKSSNQPFFGSGKGGLRDINEGDVDLRAYTRDSNNEHKVLFKKLNNPILVGYVFAHITKDGIPVPGYSFPFRMSPQDYYAMPGEVQNLK
jgi:conjugative transfer region lipoprotein (TIGR03751 family)